VQGEQPKTPIVVLMIVTLFAYLIIVTFAGSTGKDEQYGESGRQAGMEDKK
jgi:hypothetical protein